MEREESNPRLYRAAREWLDWPSTTVSGAQEETRARLFAQSVRLTLRLDDWIPPRRTIFTVQEREALNKALELRLGPIKKRSLANVILRRVAGLGVLYWLLSKFGYV